MFTQRGVIKKTEAAKYANIRASGLIAIKLDENDVLTWVRKSRAGDSVMIITKEGQAIRFMEDDARLLGRSTRGVRGIKLRANDEVVAADVASSDDYAALVLSGKGLGKRTNITQYSLQKRGGFGVKTLNVTERTGRVVGGRLVPKDMDADLIITSKNGQVIRMALSDVPMLGRVTQGVTLMRLKASDKVASFTVLTKEVEDDSAVQQKDKPETPMTEPASDRADSGKKPQVASKPVMFKKRKISTTSGTKKTSRTVAPGRAGKKRASGFSRRTTTQAKAAPVKNKSRLNTKHRRGKK